MDKIMELLKAIGGSDELVQQICEELKSYDKEIQNKYEELHKVKLSKAKKVCMEEVEAYKLELSRKVSTFLESKSAEIEKRLEERKAIEESEATSKLRRVREVTEGIEVADDAEVQALKEQVKQLTQDKRTLSEEKATAEELANRANAIAMDVIREHKQNGTVVSEDASRESTHISEGTDTPPAEPKPEEQPLTEEDKQKNKQAVTESIKKGKKKLRKPKTTRRTSIEQQMLTEDQGGELHVDSNIARIAEDMKDF